MKIRWIAIMVLAACAAAIAQALLPPPNPGATVIAAIAPATAPLTSPSDTDDMADDDTPDVPDTNSTPSTNPSTNPSTETVASTRTTTQFPTGTNTRRTRARNGRTGRNTSLAMSTQPSTMAVGAMSPDFYVLATRNIFIKGQQIVRPVDAGGGGNTGPGIPSPDSLIFNGVTFTNQNVVAFIENIAAAQVTIVEPGDSMGPGKIVDITMDYLDYEADGKTYRVTIGQNLYGGSAVSSTQPSGASGVDVDTMIKKLQLKRQEEERGLR